jgi:uncharacterized protein with HEPN domain
VPPRDWRVRIEDILDAGYPRSTIRGRDGPGGVRGGRPTLDAVSRCFGIIGEAVSHVPQAVTGAHPELPWAEMRAMRNIVVHEYFGVTGETFFKTACEDLAEIVEPLRKLLTGA